jgi:recombination protein RecT
MVPKEVDLELYTLQSDLKPCIEKEIRSRIIKEKAIGLCLQYPQAFVLLPIGSRVESPGTWGKYPFDDSTEFHINTSHPETLEFLKKISVEERETIMSQELTKTEDMGIKKMLAANIKAIKTVLPKHMTPERMMRIAYTAISRNPGLARCTPISLLNAVIEASMLGLEVNSPLEQAVMVPFWNGRNKTFEAQLIPEYKGKIELAYRSGMVSSFQAHPVFSEDTFHYNYGLHPDLVHVPGKKQDRGKLIAGYAVVNYINGGYDFEVVEEPQAMAAKARSESAQRDEKNKTTHSAWNTEDEPAMWVKTAVHQLFKRVPKSPEYIQIARAQELSAKADAGEPQDFDYLNAELVTSPTAGLEEGSGGNGGKGAEGTTDDPASGTETPTAKEEAGQTKQSTLEPPPPTEPPPVKEKSQEPPKAQSKGTNLEQVTALFKADSKLYYQACKEVEINEVLSESSALTVLRKAVEISNRTKRK